MILKTLGFKLTFTTIDDFIDWLLAKLFDQIGPEVNIDEQKYVIQSLAMIQCWAFCYSWEFLEAYRMEILAISAVKIAVLLAQ